MLLSWDDFFTREQPVDIAREMAALTLTITARAMFGVNLADSVKEIGEAVNRVAHNFEKPSSPGVIQARDDFQKAVDFIIASRRDNFTDQGDLLSSLITARDEQGNLAMDDSQLRNEVMGLLLAGYETTANALTWTYYLLSQNLWAVERLRDEARQVLQGQLPTASDLPRLPFHRQVLDESLRLFPPAWINRQQRKDPLQESGQQTSRGRCAVACRLPRKRAHAPSRMMESPS